MTGKKHSTIYDKEFGKYIDNLTLCTRLMKRGYTAPRKKYEDRMARAMSHLRSVSIECAQKRIKESSEWLKAKTRAC